MAMTEKIGDEHDHVDDIMKKTIEENNDDDDDGDVTSLAA